MTATELTARIGTGPGKIRGTFGVYLAEVAATDLAAPGTFTATPYDTNVVLSWADISSETNYKLERSPNADFLPDTVVTASIAANATTYTDTTVSQLTGYHYKIHGTASGKDAGHKILFTTTVAALAASASLVASAIVGTTLTMTWAAVAGATGYVLERDTAADFSGASAIYTGALVTFDDSGLTGGGTYYYRVHATKANYTTVTYTTATVTTALLSAPSVPVASGVGDTEMTLTWGTVTHATGYVLQRSTSGGSLFTTSTNVYTGSLLTFQDTGLTAGTTYYYRAYATASGYANSVVSATCTQATAAVLAAPAAPTFASLGQTTLTLNWVKVSGATGYVVQRSVTAGGTYVTVAGGTVGDVATLAVTGLSADTDNYFKVYATAANFTTITKSAASLVAHTTA